MSGSAVETAEYQLERIFAMRSLFDSVEGELHVAIALASNLGVSIEDLAKRAALPVEKIGTIIAGFANEDLHELAEAELNWVRYHHGAIYS